MKLAIFAAPGGIGRQVLEQAVAAGHDITAVVRNPAKLSREVRAVTSDLAAPDRTKLESALKGDSGQRPGLDRRTTTTADRPRLTDKPATGT
jgi:putative NADH-flavin reductase